MATRDWFGKYASNTLAGGGNQSFFTMRDGETCRGRVYYRVFAGGAYNYSLLFSNIIDSTFADGSESHCNLIIGEWRILEASLGVCGTCGETVATEPENPVPLSFQGRKGKHVMPGEFFTSDPVAIDARKGEYLCLEIAFQGSMIPCHEESLLPVFVWEDNKWIPSRHVPLPGMVGCDRAVHGRIGFLGDSITQGIGTPVNAYTHWNALVAEALGEEYSFWNLGLGFGRARDAASDGAWLFKAKQTDAVVLCYGVNDICQFHGRAEELQQDLLTIIQALGKNGVRVLIQTVPPFGFSGTELEAWLRVNAYIRGTLSRYADCVFDAAAVLTAAPEREGKALYGGHPNEAGCAAWAKTLAPVMKGFLATI